MSASLGSQPTQRLLDVRELEIAFNTDGDRKVAVNDTSFHVDRGEVVAIVGESGSGKSTLAMATLGLLAANGSVSHGSVLFDGSEVSAFSEAQWRRIRGPGIGLVPQDPMSNLNPRMRVGTQVGEILLKHGIATRSDLTENIERVLARAGIDDPQTRMRQFPHELSGGLRQRVLIAMGTACDPKLLVADEPTSALDVTVQRRILDQIAELSRSMGMAVLMITHDLALAAERADRVIVMCKGEIVESGAAAEILQNPQHEYTKLLVSSDPGVRALEGEDPPRAAPAVEGLPLVEIRHLSKEYRRSRLATPVIANRDVSMSVPRGRTVAIVGESGSGKTTVSRMLLLLTAPTSGDILFEGRSILGMSRSERADFRRRVQPVFQDPYSSLNPTMTVRELIEEPLQHYRVGSRAERRRRVTELMESVSLLPELQSRHPSELSGGQRQRVAIARAIALQPELLVCDEPVSALDVVVQKQILTLLAGLQEREQLTYVFISHDLAVVREIADYVCVMKDGEVIEQGNAIDIFGAPQEPYTRELLDAARLVSVRRTA